jgi:hypothetical protein
LVWEKSPLLAPVTEMFVKVKLTLPVLVRVTDWEGLARPTDWLPKVRFGGEMLTPAPAPMPLRLTLWGLPVALSVRVTAAVRVPPAAGVKITLILQLAPAATLEPQLLVSAKSPVLLPETAMLVTLKAALPELVKAIV